jgi:Spy/CpxP family protein refolding chaperone
MKTKIHVMLFSTLLAASALLAAPLQAEPAAGEGAPKAGGPERPGGGDRLAQMRERLGLTDEQVAQLKPIFAAEREEMMAKRKELGPDATREERREAAQAIHSKYRPQIAAVLTEEQKAKVAKQRERMAKGAGGPGGAGGPVESAGE